MLIIKLDKVGKYVYNDGKKGNYVFKGRIKLCYKGQ